VKADFFQAVVFQREREILGDIARLDPFSQLVHVDVAKIFPAIVFSANFLIALLLRLQPPEKLCKGLYQRQGAVTRLGFMGLSDGRRRTVLIGISPPPILTGHPHCLRRF